MLKRNGTFDLWLRGMDQVSPQFVPSRGNWWGTTSPNAIAANVYDAVDDPAYVLYADTRHPLQGVMPVKLSQTEAAAAGGTPIVVLAKPGAAFVEAVGLTDIAVTLGGVPVDNLKVAPDGLVLKFDTPALPTGPATLSILNPNGTSATKTIQIVP